MFMLTQLEDSVRVDPGQLGMPTAIAVEEQIKTLYFDRIIHNVGLVVSLYDLVSIEGGEVHNGDGGVRFSVQFNLMMFRPFEGEVLLGRIVKSNEYAPLYL
jgi:DNA-directed RNA polymerase subunit E'/Rpb7